MLESISIRGRFVTGNGCGILDNTLIPKRGFSLLFLGNRRHFDIVTLRHACEV
jgi:hypothetical protein